MNAEAVLALLMQDLGELYPTEARRAYLLQTVQAASAFVEREGVTLTDSVEDMQLTEMYAAWLIRKRNTPEPMGRALRWALNNRVFSEKAAVSTDA